MLQLRNTRFEKISSAVDGLSSHSEINFEGCDDARIQQFVETIVPLLTSKENEPYASSKFVPYVVKGNVLPGRDLGCLSGVVSMIAPRSLNGYPDITAINDGDYDRLAVNLGAFIDTKGRILASSLCFGVAGKTKDGIQHIGVGPAPGATEQNQLSQSIEVYPEFFQVFKDMAK